MKIIVPTYILTPDAVLEDTAVAFDKKIIALESREALCARYPDAEVIECTENSLLMPGLINAHVHLEFSANKTALEYGGFMPWLNSVIAKRDELVGGCDSDCMEGAIRMMLRSGITTFGAVSSYGLDLEAAANSPQNVIFFNELIGSQPAMADALFGDFMQRLEASKTVTREGFRPAVAIHSPYSVHPVLIRKALETARHEKLPVSAHFLESPAEREWLIENSGDFAPFFNDFLKQTAAVNTPGSFLDLFTETPTLMTHVVHAGDAELERLREDGHTVIHCPVSNRLLGNGAIDLDALERHGISWLCATDGLSSNYRLDLFEEMKIALFMHSEAPLLPLAEALLRSVTRDAAKALGLNSGTIEPGRAADFITLQLDSPATAQLPLHLLLQRYALTSIHINGNPVEEELWKD